MRISSPPSVWSSIVNGGVRLSLNTFNSEAGSISGRFSINAIKGVRPVPTGIDIVGGTDSKEPIKFLYHDKVFILHNGVIYDATGKKVREINK